MFLEFIILFKPLFYVKTYFLHENFSIISTLTELNFFQIISKITIDFSALTSLFHVCFSLSLLFWLNKSLKQEKILTSISASISLHERS